MKHRALVGVVGVVAASLVPVTLWAAPSGAVKRCAPKSKARGHAAAACRSDQRRGRVRPRPASRPNSFDGSCKLSGDLVFDTPLGGDLRTTTLTDNSTGTCTGKLNGIPVHRIPVVNRVTGSATASCATGKAHTVDTLIFAHRVRILIITDSFFAATQGVAHTTGAVSGHSVEHVNLLPYTDQSTLAACQAGTLRSAHFDLDAQTITPLVG
jgi:hypothetical protein